MKRFAIVVAVVVGAVIGLSAGIILNQGLGFPTNGNCTPFPNEAGICSDNGVLSGYGADGVLFHLPVPGKDGLPGKDGVNGVNGADGKNGLDGQPGKDGLNGKDGQPGRDGLNGKDGTYPTSFTLTCATGFGGATHSSKCTITVP